MGCGATPRACFPGCGFKIAPLIDPRCGSIPPPKREWRESRLASGLDRLMRRNRGDVDDLAHACVHGDELDGVGQADQQGADGSASA